MSECPETMPQDESDELPELNFGKQKLLWWAYGDIKAEHDFDRLAAGEGEDPRRVKKKVFDLLEKLAKWERVYLLMLFIRVETRGEWHALDYTDADMKKAVDIVRKKIDLAKEKMMRERRKAQAQAQATAEAPSTPIPSTQSTPAPSTAEATPPAEAPTPAPAPAKRRRKRE